MLLYDNDERSKPNEMTDKMRREWNERAKRNVLHYICASRQEWDEEDFFRSGEEVAQRITDPCLRERVTSPERKTALDIGCGAGRVTGHLSKRFKYVIGTDVSQEMIEIAKSLHMETEYDNVQFIQNNGTDFAFIRDRSIDYVFSFVVFQHMPSKKVIEANIKEISRVLSDEGICQIQFTIPRGWMRLFRIIPFPRRLIPFIPSRLIKLFISCLPIDPLKKGNSWIGTILKEKEIHMLFQKYGMQVDCQEDPTGSGSILAVGQKKDAYK